MNRETLIRQALAYRRNTGASLSDIRTYASVREDRSYTQEEDRSILSALSNSGTVYRVGKKWFLTVAGYETAKGSALEAEWEKSDAWILLAALCYRERASVQLHEIIAAADFINHAIPTVEEIHGSLNRLNSGGLLKARMGGFSVTARSQVMYEAVQSSCKKAVLDQLDGLSRIMSCPCCGVRLKKVNWRIRLDDAVFDSAVKTYLGKAR